jgi:hypothetical protein
MWREGSQKVFVQIVKSKISLKEDATEGVKFLFLTKSSIIIALGYVNHHLWKQLTQTHTHTHRQPTFKGSYQMCNCRWVVVVVVVVVGVEEHGALKRKRLLVSWQVFFLFFLSYCPTIIITVIWTRSPRTRRRSKSFQTHNNNNNIIITTNSINLVLCNTTLMIAAS